MKLLRTLTLSLLIFLLGGSTVFAQGWERTIDLGSPEDYAEDVIPVTDGYVISGAIHLSTTYSATSLGHFVAKVDTQGQLMWNTVLHISSLNSQEMVRTTNGDFLLCGTLSDSTSMRRVFVAKISATGDSLWLKSYTHDTMQCNSMSMVETSTGEILVGVNYANTNSIPSYLRLSANGDSLGYNTPTLLEPYTDLLKMVNTKDHQIVAIATTTGSLYGVVYAAKVSEVGDTLWTRIYDDTAARFFPENCIETHDSGFVISGLFTDNNNSPAFIHSFLMKIDKDGNMLWWKPYVDSTHFTYASAVVEDAQGRLIVSDHWETPNQHSSYHWITLLRITDANGNELRHKVYPQLPGVISFQYDIAKTPDGGFIMAGGKGFYRTLADVYLIKMDSLGNVYPATINGNVFYDVNQNCTIDTGEMGMPNRIVKATNGVTDYFAASDTLGNYTIECNTGTYTLSVADSSGYWATDSTCNDSSTVILTANTDTIHRNIAMSARVSCPLMQVQVNAAFLRLCLRSPAYTVNYCNLGTVSAAGVYTDITLDPNLVLDSSSVAYTSLGNNVYRFNLGTVGVNQCGDFQMYISTSCSIALNSTHCVSAHIYPDSSCVPPSTLWDRSNLVLQSTCNPDSLEFKILNTGNNMGSSVRYSIIQDDVLYATGSIQLNSLQVFTKKVPSNGSTWTLITAQTPGHPGNNHPVLSVEGCGTNSQGTFSRGFVTMFPQNDQDPFYDILCLQAVTSHDPNAKTAEPKGLDTQGQIDQSQPITYTLHFQNTGNDTAFMVAVLDTLSPQLDLSTLRVVGSSHPYHWNINLGRVLEFDFYPIFLPDSTTNEPASNGFITFTISPVAGLPAGTEIRNTGYIYFDANPAVPTNTTLHTIGELYKTWLAVQEIHNPANLVHCYPNPNSGKLMVDYQSQDAGATFVIFDMLGKKVFEQAVNPGLQQMDIGSLNSGIYLYQLTGKNGTASGKLTKF